MSTRRWNWWKPAVTPRPLNRPAPRSLDLQRLEDRTAPAVVTTLTNGFFRLNTESALVAPISARIGLKLGYVIRYDNLPGLRPDPNPNGERFKKTDRFLTAGITLSY